MKVWLSIDLDYITGDCRGGEQRYRCPQDCDDCCGVPGSAGMRPTEEPNMDLFELHETATLCLLQDINLARLVVRDNHAAILPFLRKDDLVVSIDHHSDKEPQPLCCSSWVNYATARGVLIDRADAGATIWDEVAGRRGVHVLEEGLPVHVFACLSSPYTHPIADQSLGKLIVQARRAPIDIDLRR